MTARSSILDRVLIALANREVVAHPGSFEGWRPVMHSGDPTEQFTEMFEKAGGEVVSFTAQAEASLWVRGFLACLLYTSPSPRDLSTSRMPSSA